MSRSFARGPAVACALALATWIAMAMLVRTARGYLICPPTLCPVGAVS